MPKAEVDLGVTQVEEMIDDQYPALARASVVPIGEGWDNFMFRVGDGHVARFPRRRCQHRWSNRRRSGFLAWRASSTSRSQSLSSLASRAEAIRGGGLSLPGSGVPAWLARKGRSILHSAPHNWAAFCAVCMLLLQLMRLRTHGVGCTWLSATRPRETGLAMSSMSRLISRRS